MNLQFGSLHDASFAHGRPYALPAFGKSKRARRLAVYTFLIGSDALSVLGGFLASNALLLDDMFASPGLKLCFLAVPIFLGSALINRAYGRQALYKSLRGTTRSIMALLATMGLIFFFLYGLAVLKPHHLPFMATGFLISAGLIAASRYFCHVLAEKVLDKNPISELIIVDGLPGAPVGQMNLVLAREAGLRADTSCPHMLDRLGHLFQSVDRVMIACPEHLHRDWTLVLRSTGVDGEVHHDFRGIGALDAAWPLDPRHIRPLTRVQLSFKRAVDLVLVSIALVFLAPLMLLTAIAIRLDSPGPVFFMQQRLGYGSRLFNIYKFRSMRAESCDATGDVSTMRDDDRITRVGKFIRMTSIDELPQLFNVLAGSMSLVGPRPHALGSRAQSKLFWEIDRNYWLRHATVPGLTGLAQIRGFRGATMEQADLENRLAADLEYIQNWSLALDIEILLRTFGIVVHRNAF
jgi:polysaccharide biosynthesis protein PslA